MNKLVIISAGHGGKDVGAIGQNTTEAAECIQIANRLADMIRADARLQAVVVPHELALVETIAWVKARYKNMNDGLLLDIHKNSFSSQATGVEVYYYGGDTGSQALAQKILDGMMSIAGMPRSRGVKPDTSTGHGRLGIIRDTAPTALLIEAGFVSNGGDAIDDAADQRYALGIFSGVLNIFGLVPKPVAPPAPVPVPTPTVKYKVYNSTGKQLGAYNTEAGAWNMYKDPEKGGAKIIEMATGYDVTGEFVNKFRPRTETAPPEAHPVYDPSKDLEQDKQIADQAKQISELRALVNSVVEFLKNTFKSFLGGK